MSIKVIRYRLPSYWACPLINDDYTGITDEECEEIQRFLEAAEGYPVDVDLIMANDDNGVSMMHYIDYEDIIGVELIKN